MQRIALILSLSIAIVASIFAIWPVVADAPWEDGMSTLEIVPAPPATTDPRCETAIAIKADATVARAQSGQINIDAYNTRIALQQVIDSADRDIRRYC